MAKAFYSIEEVCEMLGKSQDEIRELVREGKLREFRDAGKIFFKAEDVGKLGGRPPEPAETPTETEEITLEPAEEPSGAADSEGSSVIGLEPIEEAEPPPRKGTVITASGIGVFDDDELEIDADPLAETQITTGPSEDQVALEGTGSGSGLIDLTREADDTSLGAELLDEIYPGEEEAEAAPAVAEAPAEEEAAEEVEEAAPAPAPTPAAEVVPAAYAAAVDPSEGLFSGLLVGALIVLMVAGSVMAGMLQGYFPDYGKLLSDHFLYFLIGAAAVPIIALLVGWLIGKAATPRRG